MTEKYWRSRIGELWKQGYTSKGVIHIGANDGFEVEWYKALGIKHIICIEPLPSAIAAFKKKNPDTLIYEYAFGQGKPSKEKLNIASGDGGASSLLEKKDEEWIGQTSVEVVNFKWFVKQHNIDLSLYDALVIDVQGYELQVLKGMGNLLNGFTRLNVEVSKKPIYEGEASGKEVLSFLKEKGYRNLNEIPDHNDLLLVK